MTVPNQPRPNPFAPSQSQQQSGNRPNGSLLSRTNNRFSGFGATEIRWTIAPLERTAVRISLEGLGDPLHRLLGIPLNPERATPVGLVLSLTQSIDLYEKTVALLDQQWETFGFTGIAVLYPFQPESVEAFTRVWEPGETPIANQQANTDDESDGPVMEAPKQLDIECLRAIDIAFILNVLGRTRGNFITADSPLALETPSLAQNLLCDDVRFTSLARATGSLAETWG